MVLVICQSQYMFSLLEMLREVTLVWTCIYKVECALAYMIDSRCIAVSETRNGMVEFGKSSHWLDILWKYVSFFPKKKLNVLVFFSNLTKFIKRLSKLWCTTGFWFFAECRPHSAKPALHSAKALPSAALGKEHSAKNSSAKNSLPSATCRALDKAFAECHVSTRQS